MIFYTRQKHSQGRSTSGKRLVVKYKLYRLAAPAVQTSLYGTKTGEHIPYTLYYGYTCIKAEKFLPFKAITSGSKTKGLSRNKLHHLIQIQPYTPYNYGKCICGSRRKFYNRTCISLPRYS